MVKLGRPFRKPLRTAFNNVEIFGLQNNWCANFTLLARLRTECMKVVRLMPGCMVGQLTCGAQLIPGGDCGRAVRMSPQLLICNVHKSVDTFLYPHNITFPLSSTTHLSFSNTIVHPALHNDRMPISNVTARCGTMWPIKIVGNPGIVMSQMCVNCICWPSGMLMTSGLWARHLLTTSTLSIMKMDIAPMLAITWVVRIVIAFKYSCVGMPHNARAAVVKDLQG